ncbi:MAG: T9SS C-terminal target domain-containing protein [Bacteroidetes bacterium]|nr:MAG: T9SS C-terminal target domain-containing protein [Bacteroidota bacterium]
MKNAFTILTTLLSVLFASFTTAQDFDVYVSDAANFSTGPWHIYKYDKNGFNGQKFISDHLGWPQDILFLEDQNIVLISNLNDGTITKYNADTGEYIGVFASGIGGPTRMSIGPDGLLYVLQWQGNGKVKRYQLNGTSMGDFTASGVSNSIGIAWDEDGNLYVSSYNGGFVKKFSSSGVDLGFFITGLNGPTNIWFGTNGDFYVSDWNEGVVKRYSPTGQFKSTVVTGVSQVEGVALYPNGNFAIGVGSCSCVNVYKPDGTLVTNLVSPGAAGLIRPNAVVFRQKDATPQKEVFKEQVIVHPNIGSHFRISGIDADFVNKEMEVYNAAGTLVQKIELDSATTWDASHLPNGMYYLTIKLEEGYIGRQEIIVQK